VGPGEDKRLWCGRGKRGAKGQIGAGPGVKTGVAVKSAAQSVRGLVTDEVELGYFCLYVGVLVVKRKGVGGGGGGGGRLGG